MRYACTVCGFIYDEAKGIPEAGIPAGTKWSDLPADWVCPLCGATKAEFAAVEDPKKPVASHQAPARMDMPNEDEGHAATDMVEMTPRELSALCSNLARGCEKQYKGREAELFSQLSDYFASAAKPAEDSNYGDLLRLIEVDLNQRFPSANSVCEAQGDRGARRALVWSEKVTRILQSLLTRYARDGEAMLVNTGVYVCTICGFVYVGDKLPDLCPICKVPNWKFEKIEEVPA